MKTVKVSDLDYKRLMWLGGPKWMTVESEKPLRVEKVLHRLVEEEYSKANPPKDYGYER